MGSVVVGLQALEHGLQGISCPEAREISVQDGNLSSLHWQTVFLATRPPGKSLLFVFT